MTEINSQEKAEAVVAVLNYDSSQYDFGGATTRYKEGGKFQELPAIDVSTGIVYHIDSLQTSSCTATYSKNSRFCYCDGCDDATMMDDPHLKLGHGGIGDFRGANHTSFNLLSHTNLSVAAIFHEASYVEDDKKVVHGSYMTHTYVVATTTTGKEMRVALEAGLVDPTHATVQYVASGETIELDGKATPSVSEGNVQVAFSPPSEHGVRLSVTQLGRWAVGVSSGAKHQYVDVSPSGGGRAMWRVDVTVAPLSPSMELEAVAPHGIIGQSYDGDNIAVSGATDDYNMSVVTTSAQAEGGLEGTWTDYIVASPYSTHFKYSRYSGKPAPARDIAKLTGRKAKRVGDKAADASKVWA